MAIELVNIGTQPNDGEGDPLRVAFSKINNNFIWLDQTSTNITSSITLDDTANQVIFEYPTNAFTQAKFQIKSYREDTNDSESISIDAQLSNDANTVAWTAYNITVIGDWLTQYDMDVVDGNVRILVSPLVDEVINHFIAYQVTWDGDLGVGIAMTSEGGAGLLTEFGNAIITTESV
jgi:hypothetical protein